MSLSPKALVACLDLLLAAGLVTGYLLHEQGQQADAMQRARLVDVEAAGQLYLLEKDGLAVGLSRLSVESSADSVVVTEETEIHLPTPRGRIQHAHEEARQVLSPDLAIRRFRFEVTSGGNAAPRQSVRMEGVRTGPDSLRADLWTGGRKREEPIAAPRDVVLGSGLWVRLALGGKLEPNTRHRLQELDPVSLSLRPVFVRVGGMELVPLDPTAPDSAGDEGVVRAYRVHQRVGGSQYDLLVSERGMPVRAQLPLGVDIRPATVAEVSMARTRWSRPDWAEEVRAGHGEGASLVTQSALGAGVSISNLDARRARRMRVRVSGAEIPTDTDGGSQSVDGSVVTVRRVPLPRHGEAGYRLPAQIGWGTSPLADRADLAPYLAPGPFVESDRPPLREAARTALRGTRDPVVATRRINRWVHERLDKVYTASIPSAVEALRGGEGDCNEHTVLAIALYRAAGVPARAASGVVYLDGRFFFHAWPEVWLGGRWVPVDPTFGVAPADPARLRFYSGVSKLHGVLDLLGRLELEGVVLDTPSSE